MWAICSGRSGKMSDCERFAQVAHDKWVNVSDSLRSLRTNGQMSESLGFLLFRANRSFSLSLTKNERFAQKKFGKKSYFLYVFYSSLEVKKKKSFAHSFWAKWANRPGCSGQMSDCEPFAQVTQKEWAIVSKLVRSLTKNERMSKSLTFCANGSFAHFFGKNSR